ncbi:MAG: sigma-54 dependent transcriptional regulator [Kofleriaceae bacterium]
MSSKDSIKVLIIDDDQAMISAISSAITKKLEDETVEVEIESAPDGVTILYKLETRNAPWDVVLLDVDLPGISGPRLLDQFRECGASCSVIMLSADASATTAADCMRAGAFHYLTKPFKPIELVEHVVSAARHSRLRRQLVGSRTTTQRATNIIGNSIPMKQLRAAISRVAEQSVSVLIQGESGTGKELVAKAVHDRGPRRHKPFVAVNCGAIPEALIDSELFGHQKGSFTGALTDRAGFFVEADGGTIFLDEIGDMPLAVQARLLRVLQESEVRPVGSTGVRKIDVRVIAASHVDLNSAAEHGKFRKDLYYRLNVVVLAIPALRERLDDLPGLAALFLQKHSSGVALTLNSSALDALNNYGWPGNVRELENALISAIALRTGDTIGVESLPPHIRKTRGSVPILKPELAGDEQLSLVDAKKRVSSAFERDYLQQIMQRAQGSVAEAARMAGIDRTNFRRLLQRHNIDPGNFK